MPTKQHGEDSFLSLVLPKDTLTWFDIKSSSADEETLYATLVEKNNPPKEKGCLTFKGYKDITITDFPIRGKRTELTFRRRYWRESGSKQLITNDIKLAFPGTKLETEFANFLKDEGGDSPYITFVYSSCLQPDIQRVRETIQRPPL